MSPTMKDLGIDHLSVAQRFDLVQEIWDSIATSDEPIPLTEAQKRLIDKRCADLEANPDQVLTWAQIKASVRGQK